jgi:hypothetical protein
MDGEYNLRWSFDDRLDRSVTTAAGRDMLVPQSYREREHSNTLAGLLDLTAPNSIEAAPAGRSTEETVRPEEESLPVRVATSTASW